MEELRFKQLNINNADGGMFNTILCNEYDKILNYYKNNVRLNDYQRLCANYFQAKSNFRSLLLYHGTGLGKTATAITVINNILSFSKDLMIIIICPAALRAGSWIPNLKEWGNNKNLLDKVSFLSLDSPSFINEFDIVTKSLSFNIPSLIIIDECHLFISSLTEETSPRRVVYFSLLELINNYKTYLLCLSATPIVNKIEEIVYLFNLLRPNTFHNKVDIFYQLFINELTGNIKNHNIFCKRITGLVSYFETENKKGMPEVKKIKIKLKMSKLQTESYKFYENEELNIGGGYKQKTIGACNFTLPLNVIETSRSSAFNIGTFIKDSDPNILNDMSPKFIDIINKIKTSTRPNLIHSSHIKSTIVPLEFYLQRFGYTHLTDKSKHDYKNYISIFGEINPNERDRLLHIFNSEANKDGKIIKVFIISDVFSAGVTIKHVENLFILNYHWNSTKILQVFGRVARLNTHITLPEVDQFVNIYTYVMIREYGETSDEHLEAISIKKDNINNLFLHLMKISSIDINFNKSNFNYIYKDIEPYTIPIEYIDTMKPFITKSIIDDEDLIKYKVTDMNLIKKIAKQINVSYFTKNNIKKKITCLLVYPIVDKKYYLLDLKYKNYIGQIKVENDYPIFDSNFDNCFESELII